MARVSTWTLGSYVWGDKTLQALQFADDKNDHVNPQAQDIDINSLIADYVSQTDITAQTVASALGITPSSDVIPLTLRGFSGGVSDLFDIKDGGGTKQFYVDSIGNHVLLKQFGVGALPTASTVALINDNPLASPNLPANVIVLSIGNTTANKLSAGAGTYSLLGSTGALDINGQTNETMNGLNFVPTITNPGAGAATVPNFRGINVTPRTSGAGGITITNLVGVEIAFAHLSTLPTVVTSAYALKIDNFGRTFYTNAYGIDIGVISGPTTVFGIREQSGGTNRLSSKTRIGDQTLPTEFLEVAGNILATLNLKQNTNPGAPSTIGLVNSAGSSILVPALDHIHGALAGTVVLINADETQASGTIPNTDTNVKTYSLGTNTYSNIIVEAEGYGSFVVTSTNQIVSIKIKDGATQKGQTMTLDAALGATSRIPFTIKASFAEQTAQTLSVTISAPAADANTTIFLNSLRVYGVV